MTTQAQPINIITSTIDKTSKKAVFRETNTKGFHNPFPSLHIVYGTADQSEPLKLDDEADLTAFENHDYSAIFPKAGSNICVVDYAPLMEVPMHDTLSVDYGVLLYGQIEWLLDSGEKKTLKAGDMFLQRGTMHSWVNPSETEWTRILFFLIPAEKPTAASSG